MSPSPRDKARVEALRSAPLDSWIALSADESRVVAQGSSFDEVTEELARLGDDTSFILKTPPDWSPLAL
jgi:hypothetical protein